MRSSYIFLHQSMKNLIDREPLRENWNRIAEKNKAVGPKDTKAAPAKGDGRTGTKGSPSRGRSQERGKYHRLRMSLPSKLWRWLAVDRQVRTHQCFGTSSSVYGNPLASREASSG